MSWVIFSYILLFVYKSVFYYSLGNLRPPYCARINQIQLLALVKQSDITKYSMSKTLEPFVRDVTVLVSKRLQVMYIIFNYWYPEIMYGTFSWHFSWQISSFFIGGFKENSSANQTCVGTTLWYFTESLLYVYVIIHTSLHICFA